MFVFLVLLNFFQKRVMYLKRVQGQLRDALWARSSSKDALREAEYSEVSEKFIVEYKLQVTFDEEALAYAKSKFLEITADIRRMEKSWIVGMNPLEWDKWVHASNSWLLHPTNICSDLEKFTFSIS